MINQKTFGKATTNWEAHPEQGASYRLVDGVLLYQPLLENGYPDMGDEAEVAFGELDSEVEAAAEAVARKMQADAEEAREAYTIALTHYLDAAEKLSESWDDNMDPANYPKYMPSFDQHALNIRAWLEAEVGKP